MKWLKTKAPKTLEGLILAEAIVIAEEFMQTAGALSDPEQASYNVDELTTIQELAWDLKSEILNKNLLTN